MSRYDDLPPGLREMITGKVELSAEERDALTGEVILICLPLEMDEAGNAGFWQKRGMAENEHWRCERCQCVIVVRPWAAIARHKVCSRCIEADDMRKAETELLDAIEQHKKNAEPRKEKE